MAMTMAAGKWEMVGGGIIKPRTFGLPPVV